MSRFTPQSTAPPRSPRRRPVPYGRALEAQERLVARRAAGEIPDLLWLLEHPPTITFGTAGGEAHLRGDREDLVREGFELFSTRRGGDVTCHEPGQLVAYPIVRLGACEEDRDLHLYLRRLEEAIVRLLGGLGLAARRFEGRTGVWLDDRGPPRKVAAIGVRCSRWVTSHGIALNVENDLRGFRRIVPCGIADAGVTRLAGELPAGALPSWEELADRLHREIERALDRPLERSDGEEGIARARTGGDDGGPGPVAAPGNA